jgi:hypothetical protein
MHRVSRSMPLLLALGLALAGCGNKTNPEKRGGSDSAAPGTPTVSDNQALCSMDGIV